MVNGIVIKEMPRAGYNYNAENLSIRSSKQDEILHGFMSKGTVSSSLSAFGSMRLITEDHCYLIDRRGNVMHSYARENRLSSI